MSTSRLGQFPVGVKAYGTFAPKTPAAATRRFTRLGQIAIGVARYGTFAPKTPAAAPTLRGFLALLGAGS